MKKLWSWFLNSQEMSLLLVFIILCVITGILNPVFFTFRNLIVVSRSFSLFLIIAVLMNFVIILREIDLSVGSVVALSGTVCGLSLVSGLSIPLSIIIGISTGTLMGFINGFLITRFSIHSFVVTLAMLYAARGAVYVIGMGRPIYPFPKSFAILGEGKFLGIPILVFIALAWVIVGNFFLAKTTYGRAVYAVGGNSETATRAGLNVKKIKQWSFLLNGLSAGISGVLLVSRLSVAQPSMGTGWELQIIAAVVIGGTSLLGGEGTILGTLIGVMFISILNNIMILIRINVYWQNIVVGLILILATILDTVRRRKQLPE